MLLPVTTLLARSRRAKRLAPYIQVSTLEVLEGALLAARQEKRDVIIELNLEKATLDHVVFVATATSLCASHPSAVGLVLAVRAHASEIEMVLRLGVPSIRPVFPKDTSLPERTEFIAWFTSQASQYGIEVGASFSRVMGGDEVRHLCDSSSASFVVMPVREEQRSRRTLVPAALKDLGRGATVPVVADEEMLTSLHLTSLRKAGICGLFLGETLEKSYTAGVRAGLRDRMVTDPSSYQRKGMLAVKNTVIHYLQAA
ncbi:MAG: hypothetical protein WCO52_02555 [bacterium]